MSKKILLSGVQPTGTLHIGNYFGAIRQFVDLQDKYDTRIFIADFHAITTVQDKELLSRNIYDIVCDYLALGLDPEKIVLFQQSKIPEVAELTWYFNCLTTVPYLERAHAYKDKVANGKEPSVGLFDYPILMASDILIQDAHVVPVGQDQKQHIEFARDIAEKFNRVYGETFRLPEPLIMDTVAIVPGTDGRKMSKSYGNTIPLFATEEEIKKAVMSIPTDSRGKDEVKNPDDLVLYQIHKLFNDTPEIRAGYTQGLGYKDAKEMLIADINAWIAPLREKRAEIAADRNMVLGVLEYGAQQARTIVEEKMKEVREKIGLIL
ncbi:tryptophan--tRNA ligase [Candidatus Nomurabacteria bacterium]|nr:tryptophan--tRNA ligase [Candidatus Nomurabacteria bacterium]